MDPQCDLVKSRLQGEGRQQSRYSGTREYARGNFLHFMFVLLFGSRKKYYCFSLLDYELTFNNVSDSFLIIYSCHRRQTRSLRTFDCTFV